MYSELDFDPHSIAENDEIPEHGECENCGARFTNSGAGIWQCQSCAAFNHKDIEL